MLGRWGVRNYGRWGWCRYYGYWLRRNDGLLGEDRDHHFLFPVGDGDSALPESRNEQQKKRKLADDDCAHNAGGGKEAYPAKTPGRNKAVARKKMIAK